MKVAHIKRFRYRNRDYLEYLWSRRISRGSEYPKRQWVHESVPKFQLAFKDWLREAQRRIRVPIQIIGRTRRGMILAFSGYPSCLSISVRPSEISVWVKWQGECIDTICDLDMSIPVSANSSIFCEMCLPEHVIQYSTLIDYWRGHQFEKFASWLNERLAPARWLVIYQNFARLHVDRPETESGLLALIELPPLP